MNDWYCCICGNTLQLLPTGRYGYCDCCGHTEPVEQDEDNFTFIYLTTRI